MSIYSFIIVVSTIAIGISPFFHTPSSYRKKYKRNNKLVTLFNQKKVKVIYYALFSVLILFCSEIKQNDSESFILSHKIKSDAALAKKIIQAEKESKTEVTTILGKYGFMLDTTNQLLVKIRDKPIAVKPDFVYPDVVSRITVDTVTDNTVKYRVVIHSIAARSTIVRLSLSPAGERSGEFSLAQAEHQILSNAPISKDGTINFTGTITNHDATKMSKIALRLRGIYQSDNGKKFPLDEFLIYDLIENEGGQATALTKEKLKRVFE